VAERALGLCGGNPLLLRHLGAGLRRGEDLPEGQTAFPVARFAGLGELGQRYLHTASVLGTRFRPAAVAGSSRDRSLSWDNSMTSVAM
jgi:hypothetical protein